MDLLFNWYLETSESFSRSWSSARFTFTSHRVHFPTAPRGEVLLFPRKTTWKHLGPKDEEATVLNSMRDISSEPSISTDMPQRDQMTRLSSYGMDSATRSRSGKNRFFFNEIGGWIKPETLTPLMIPVLMSLVYETMKLKDT